jgi:hypothetical protein
LNSLTNRPFRPETLIGYKDEAPLHDRNLNGIDTKGFAAALDELADKFGIGIAGEPSSTWSSRKT